MRTATIFSRSPVIQQARKKIALLKKYGMKETAASLQLTIKPRKKVSVYEMMLRIDMLRTVLLVLDQVLLDLESKESKTKKDK